jgi:type I site-specific restriction endonuclease
VEAETIYVPIIETFDAALATAQCELYNQNIDMTNFKCHGFKGKWKLKEKVPIASCTWLSHRVQSKAKSDEEEEEDNNDNNNSDSNSEDDVEVEEVDQKSSKKVQTLTPKKVQTATLCVHAHVCAS